MMVPGLCLLALVLQGSAIGIDKWSHKKYTPPSGVAGAKVHLDMGLWKICIRSSGNSVCKHLPIEGDKEFPKNSLYAVRAFAILGALLVLLACACSMCMKMSPKVHMAMLLVGGICSLIANGIWLAELTKLKADTNIPGMPNELKTEPAMAFYLNAVGGLIAVLVAVSMYYRTM